MRMDLWYNEVNVKVIIISIMFKRLICDDL